MKKITQLTTLFLFLIGISQMYGQLYSGVPVSDAGTLNSIGNSVTSKSVVVGNNGAIYAVFNGDAGIRVAKSTNRGQSYLPSVQVSTDSFESEIAISSNGTIYVAWSSFNDNNIYIATSTDGGATFSTPNVVGPSGFSSGLHIATMGAKVFLLPQSGNVIYSNLTNGVGAFSALSTNTSFVFSDIYVESSNGTVYLMGDVPNVTLFKSTDDGITFNQINLSSPVEAYYSSYAFSNGCSGSQLFVAGTATTGYKINLNDGFVTTISLSQCEPQSRTLVADEFGNFVDGYVFNSTSYFRVSNDQGTTWQPEVAVASGTQLNLARNANFQDIVALYQTNGAIVSNVYSGALITGNSATPSVNTTNVTACSTYTWPVNGTTYTASGTYTLVIGCQTEELVLTITTPPTQPTLACYETAVLNTTTCAWDVTGTQPTQPTLACYETATFNTTTCAWDVTGAQPSQPTLACYETATFNTTTCEWDVTGTQPTLGSVTTTVGASYTWPLPFGTGLTYTTGGVYTNTVDCNVATLNLTIAPPVNTFNIGTSCGAMLSNLSVTVVAAYVPGATAYTFRITNVATSASFVVTRPVNSIALGNYTTVTLGTEYQIAVSTNGGTTYGAPCTLFTPRPTSTIGAQCGTTLTSMTQFVYATFATSVSGYRFRVTNPATSAVEVFTPLSNVNRFSFSQLPAAFVVSGTTYSVEVAMRNTDGSYLPYGTACNITTPAFPTSEIVLSQCDTVATSNTQTFNAVVVSGATAYRFQLTNSTLGYNFSVDRPIGNYRLSMFTGLVSGTTYTVRVAVRIGGVWGPLTGKPCNVTTPGIAPGGERLVVESNDFAAITYPNPFAESFMFDVKTTNESTIQVRVYDMLGKQVENRNVEATEINSIQVGSNYPSGVYNVVVSQGENTQTLRVIKR